MANLHPWMSVGGTANTVPPQPLRSSILPSKLKNKEKKGKTTSENIAQAADAVDVFKKRKEGKIVVCESHARGEAPGAPNSFLELFVGGVGEKKCR